jgi:Na+-transporting methylmalonyl-CoA/oxaloacetate decarboxylase gamma subunit
MGWYRMGAVFRFLVIGILVMLLVGAAVTPS